MGKHKRTNKTVQLLAEAPNDWALDDIAKLHKGQNPAIRGETYVIIEYNARNGYGNRVYNELVRCAWHYNISVMSYARTLKDPDTVEKTHFAGRDYQAERSVYLSNSKHEIFNNKL